MRWRGIEQVAGTDKTYRIPFTGLKLGAHEFSFEVRDSFFESFEHSVIQSGNVRVNLTLDKKETMMVAEFRLEGTVETRCDRCDDPAEVFISGDYRLIYKFDDEPSDDETLVIVYPDQVEIDVTEPILEFITVSLPARIVHEEGECNEEMIELLKNYVLNAEDEEDEDDFDEDEVEDEHPENDEIDGEVDPRWDALKNIKKE